MFLNFIGLPMTDVGEWLSSLGLPQYAEAFEAQGVELDQRVELSDADLRELGVSALGHRKRLRAAFHCARSGDDRQFVSTDRSVAYADNCLLWS